MNEWMDQNTDDTVCCDREQKQKQLVDRFTDMIVFHFVLVMLSQFFYSLFYASKAKAKTDFLLFEPPIFYFQCLYVQHLVCWHCLRLFSVVFLGSLFSILNFYGEMNKEEKSADWTISVNKWIGQSEKKLQLQWKVCRLFTSFERNAIKIDNKMCFSMIF